MTDDTKVVQPSYLIKSNIYSVMAGFGMKRNRCTRNFAARSCPKQEKPKLFSLQTGHYGTVLYCDRNLGL